MPMRICLFEAYITHSIHRKSKFTIRTTRSTFTANQTYDDNATYNIQR